MTTKRHRGAWQVPLLVMLAAAAMVLAATASSAGGSKEERRTPWRSINVRTVADAARAWAKVRSHFGNMRKGHPHEVWVTDTKAMPRARPIPQCLAAMKKAGLSFPRVDRNCRLSAQVKIGRKVAGLQVGGTMDDGGPDLVVGCELALRLPRIAKILRDLGVVRFKTGPPARAADRSYHRFGLGLDVYELRLADGTRLVVEDDFEVQPGRGTCGGPPPTKRKAKILRQVACKLWDSRLLSTVITPNYNAGHRDHFHWDVRPGDKQFYLR